jgi:hypothetical protein
MAAQQKFPMEQDQVLGDGGNLTIYERPDSSRYALDKRGNGQEYEADLPVFGRARFDSREQSSGVWAGSRSELQVAMPREEPLGSQRRMRRRGWSRA